MVGKIVELKDMLLERMEQVINERGIERADIKELGELSDAVKDMAEAEKACMEADYYGTVTEAMEEGSMGYEMGYAQGGGSQGGSGYRRGYARGGQGGGGQGGQGYRRGYRGQSRDSQGRYTSRRGYRQARYGHGDVMQDIREMMETADPQEKEQIKQQLRQMADM